MQRRTRVLSPWGDRAVSAVRTKGHPGAQPAGLLADEALASAGWGEFADEYGIRLPALVLEEFEVDISTWYVKVTIRQNRKGQSLFFMSLHPLAFVMDERNGGPLRPEK